MATILDKLTPSAELGERVGRGTASALQSLVDSKLKKLQKQAGLMGLMEPDQADMLSQMPDNLLSVLMRPRRNQLYNSIYGQPMQQNMGQQVNNQPKQLDSDTAKIILQVSKGDKDIARKLAQQLGYSL